MQTEDVIKPTAFTQTDDIVEPTQSTRTHDMVGATTISTQTDDVMMPAVPVDTAQATIASLQRTINDQRRLIDGLAQDIDVANKRRFLAEEILYTRNLPKVKYNVWLNWRTLSP